MTDANPRPAAPDATGGQIFAFEMPLGATARVVEPAEYAAQGMRIERTSLDSWKRIDGNDPAWTWTSPGGRLMLVELEDRPPQKSPQSPAGEV